jgi:Protein of unknown function (DUF5674)
MEQSPLALVRRPISRAVLAAIANAQFGDMVKAAVDIERRVMAIGAELHSDEEAALPEDGSRQADVWGINLYPAAPGSEFIEFDAMINIRPALANRTRGVDDARIREQIRRVVAALVPDA